MPITLTHRLVRVGTLLRIVASSIPSKTRIPRRHPTLAPCHADTMASRRSSCAPSLRPQKWVRERRDRFDRAVTVLDQPVPLVDSQQTPLVQAQVSTHFVTCYPPHSAHWCWWQQRPRIDGRRSCVAAGVVGHHRYPARVPGRVHLRLRRSILRRHCRARRWRRRTQQR